MLRGRVAVVQLGSDDRTGSSPPPAPPPRVHTWCPDAPSLAACIKLRLCEAAATSSTHPSHTPATAGDGGTLDPCTAACRHPLAGLTIVVSGPIETQHILQTLSSVEADVGAVPAAAGSVDGGGGDRSLRLSTLLQRSSLQWRLAVPAGALPAPTAVQKCKDWQQVALEVAWNYLLAPLASGDDDGSASPSVGRAWCADAGADYALAMAALPQRRQCCARVHGEYDGSGAVVDGSCGSSGGGGVDGSPREQARLWYGSLRVDVPSTDDRLPSVVHALSRGTCTPRVCALVVNHVWCCASAACCCAPVNIPLSDTVIPWDWKA